MLAGALCHAVVVPIPAQNYRGPVQGRCVVDGMNVIGARPDGWWRDRDAAVRRLVASLAAWATDTGEAVTAVFDGTAPAGLPGAGPVTLVFAGRGASADDRIVELLLGADADPAGVTVVTSDAELAVRARAAGAAVTGAGGFRRRIDPYWR